MQLSRAAGTAATILIWSSVAFAAPGQVGDQWKRHVAALASDAFEGRLPGSAGEQKTVEYLVREFESYGLKPGGEVVGGRRTWFQSVPIIETAPPTIGKLSIDGGGGPGPLDPGKGLIVTGSQASGGSVDLARAPLVFVGYGIDAPEFGWNDYKGVDLTGKVAVFLFGDPVGADGKRRFPGQTMSAYGPPRLKNQAALKRGAVATLVVHEPRVLNYRWETTQNALAQVRQSLVPPPSNAASLKAQGWIREDLAQRVLATAGADFHTLKARAAERDFRPLPLGDLTLTAQLSAEQKRITTRNVIALLPGRTRPDETLIIGAHWDHQGVAAPDAKGDRVYNGAIDNASGMATVLELARDLAKRGAPERSVAFIGWTMEEPGIFGSEYYVERPIFPLAKTVAVINFDTMIPLGPARDFSQNADPANDLTELLRAAGARQGRSLTIEPHAGLFLRMRSDHGPFVRAGVPSVFYLAGEDLVNGGRARAKAYFDDYFARHYHQRSDEFSPDWDATGIVQDVALLADLSWRLANSRQWPEWQPGAEFKAVRDASRELRK